MVIRQHERAHHEDGFTFLELLLVMAVVAVVSAIAAPVFFRQSGDATLIATAQKLANEMRLARAAAIMSNVEQTLTIDLARRRYWVDGLTGASVIAKGVSVDFITLQAEQLSAKEARLRFFVDGSATGGNVILRRDGRSVAVNLNWMSGHASLRRSP